jgi:hypothetical protein
MAEWRAKERGTQDVTDVRNHPPAKGVGVNGLLPQVWRPELSELLPRDPGAFLGPALAIWLTGVLLALVTARSLVHIFAPDGGAQSIATVDTSVVGGRNIVAIFGQWGAIQLLLAGLLWVLLLRYRGLTSLILSVLLLEPFVRALSGRLKPIETVGVAPGARFNWVALPLVSFALYVSLCPAAPS